MKLNDTYRGDKMKKDQKNTDGKNLEKKKHTNYGGMLFYFKICAEGTRLGIIDQWIHRIELLERCNICERVYSF
jgi:hypothetical protein